MVREAFLPDLAMALNNLGIRYSEVGRRPEAVAPVEEAVATYRDLAAVNPAFLPDLAMALNNLGNRYSAVGRTAEIDVVWQAVLSGMPDSSNTAYLLLRRAEGRNADEVARVTELLEAETLVPEQRRDLISDFHETARTLRGRSPERFDAQWHEATGKELPGWLLLDPASLGLIGDWLNAVPVSAQKQTLVEHADDLLSDRADVALDEIALLQPDPASVQPFRDLLAAAREVGIDEAYRPWLAGELLATWVQADLPGKRQLLAERRAALLDPIVGEILAAWRENNPDDVDLASAAALLAVVRAGQEERGFAALADPGRIPGLLDDLIRVGEIEAHSAMASLASTAEAAEAVRASALFHVGIALAIRGDAEPALELTASARNMAPGQVPSWLTLLVELAARHPEVIPLSRVLAAPSS